MVKRAFIWFLVLLSACAPVQSAAPTAQAPAAPSVTVSHWPARGCAGAHDMVDFGPGGYINAYPGWPPNAQPDHIVIHYPNGDSIWGKPAYGTPDCADYMHCQRATFVIDPKWNKCVPAGHLLEVVTLDGQPVLDSSLLQIVDPNSQRTVYLAFANNTWYAGPSVTGVVAQARQAVQHAAAAPAAMASNGSASQTGAQAFGIAFGVALAAALALGVVYLAARQQSLDYSAQVQQENLNYMAATQPVHCSSTWAGSIWVTNCH